MKNKKIILGRAVVVVFISFMISVILIKWRPPRADKSELVKENTITNKTVNAQLQQNRLENKNGLPRKITNDTKK